MKESVPNRPAMRKWFRPTPPTLRRTYSRIPLPPMPAKQLRRTLVIHEKATTSASRAIVTIP